MILYLADADITAGFFETLATAPPSSRDETQGWTVDKKSGNVSAGYRPDTWRLAADFGDFLPPTFTGYGYRTSARLSGTFAFGLWSLAFKVKCNSYYAQIGGPMMRLWRGTAPDGSDAVIVLNWSGSTSIGFTAANQDQAGTLVSNFSAGTFDNQYLFLEVLWYCSASGGNNAASVAWVHNEGAAEALTTPTFTSAAPPLNIDLTDQGIPTAEVVSAPTVAVSLSSLTLTLAAGESWPWQAPASSWSWRLAPNRPRQEIHICVLTGGHVSLPDLELPISSWQARLRNGDPTYVSAIVPNALAYADAITARTGGQLKVYKGYQFIDLQGGRFLALVAETTLNSIRHDTGPRSSSVTLVGYANITNATPKTFVYDTLTYKSLQADGKRRWRTGLKLNIAEAMAGDTWTFIARPGDTVTHQGESMVVGFISLAVSDTFELVELVEA
jgi:hypothetical protein